MLGYRKATRLFVLAFLAAGAIAAWRWKGVFDPVAITAAIGRYPAAPLGFLAIHSAASLLFIPRTLLAIVAGLLFEELTFGGLVRLLLAPQPKSSRCGARQARNCAGNSSLKRGRSELKNSSAIGGTRCSH